ncbi:hypothetical protein [Staphylococcus arlettae]|uniref:hypothetical protein n=1 Tax=Staphylococcus arlettae TaxID=29378 RepID=UPI003519551D
MKKLLLPLTITGLLLLGACSNKEVDKKEESKKSESVEKKKETPKKSESKKDTVKKDNESTEQTEQVTNQETNQGQTQEEGPPTIPAHEEQDEESNEGKMGPGPGDPNYKPDPKFTDPGEGYDPEEGNKMPSADSYEFKQEVENPARDQVINEGIDMDNPTDAEIERMRELAKDSPHGLQTAPSQGGY